MLKRLIFLVSSSTTSYVKTNSFESLNLNNSRCADSEEISDR